MFPKSHFLILNSKFRLVNTKVKIHLKKLYLFFNKIYFGHLFTEFYFYDKKMRNFSSSFFFIKLTFALIR